MIQFLLNDTEVATDRAAGGTLLDFVRYQKRLTGTKIGCREGDCGACTVLVGDFEEGVLRYRSVTSCLMPLGNAVGKHIVSIEGLNMKGLSPVQQAMVETNGTQCGFCTLGFVLSFTGFVMSPKARHYDEAIAAIDGNICRCTGYKSIERAARRITDDIQGKPAEDTLAWLVQEGFLPEYFNGIDERLRALRHGSPEVSGALTMTGGQHQGHGSPEASGSLTMTGAKSPGLANEAEADCHPDAAAQSALASGERSQPTFNEKRNADCHGERSRTGTGDLIVGGGTDLIVQRPHTVAQSDVQLVTNDPSLKQIDYTDGELRLGAAVTVTQILESAVVNRFFPQLAQHVKLVSSTPIRNMATIGGNLVNASPIGDLTIFLLALDAKLTLRHDSPETSGSLTMTGEQSPGLANETEADCHPERSRRGTGEHPERSRTVALRDFYKGYKQLDKAPGEIVEAISFTPPAEGTF
ncbi:MAG: 2Fe-2S iron-sulfur cluster binding domain-containing protein, partial [Chitinophagaceae bacterium]